MDCFDNDLGNNIESNAWNMEHNAEELQEILNRIMQGIMSIITSVLVSSDLSVLLYFKQKSCDGSLPPYANRKLLAQLISFGEKKQGSYTVFLILNFSQ